MTKTSRLIGAALTLLAAAASVGYARDDRREAPVEDGHALRAKDVLGSRIVLKNGEAVGTVEDIIFDQDGTIDYLVVRDEGKYVTVPWEAARFNYGKHIATVEITPQQFQEVPRYTQEQYPSFYEPAYREKIYGDYGVKPRREIRADKRH